MTDESEAPQPDWEPCRICGEALIYDDELDAMYCPTCNQ